MKIRTVMVIGAGQMGSGIAMLFAQNDKKVYLNDISMEYLEKRLAYMSSYLDESVAKGKITQARKEAAMENIIPITEIKEAADKCDLVVEAASENLEIKKGIFEQLDKYTRPDCILCTNTSSLMITEIASFTNRSDKVIGMHFMNPVPIIKLVEIICGLNTSEETYQTVAELSKEIGKESVRVDDVPGFISNRVLVMMINEAICCLNENVASAEDIDKVMKLGMGHPMGPLKLADFIGLDTVLAIMNVMQEGYGDDKYRACTLLKKYVNAGWLGKKSGRGFYTYDN